MFLTELPHTRFSRFIIAKFKLTTNTFNKKDFVILCRFVLQEIKSEEEVQYLIAPSNRNININGTIQQIIKKYILANNTDKY